MNTEFWSTVIESQLVAVAVGVVLSFLAGWVMARRSDKKAIHQTKRQNTFKLNEIYMDQVLDRLQTKVNLVEVSRANRIKGFWGTVKELEDDGKQSLRKVLSFYDSLQDLKEHGLIDLEAARGLFSREYENLYPQFQEMANTERPQNEGRGATLTQRVCKLREWLVEESAGVEMDDAPI